MKKYASIIAIMIMCVASSTYAQKISKKAVPSLIINNFQKEFPRTFDVEWKMEQDAYKVEFETGVWQHDNTVWYDKSGKKLKSKCEISKKDLPKEILNTIQTQFKGYKTNDVKKITDQNETIYTLELKNLYEEWKVSFHANGTLISKIPD